MTHHKLTGDIEFKTPGKYFVTSQVKFQGHRHDLDSNNIRHRVMHFSMRSGVSRVVLENTRSCCLNEESFEHTSTVGAVVVMGTYDIIYVLTTHNMTFIDSDSSYMSLHHSYI